MEKEFEEQLLASVTAAPDGGRFSSATEEEKTRGLGLLLVVRIPLLWHSKNKCKYDENIWQIGSISDAADDLYCLKN